MLRSYLRLAVRTLRHRLGYTAVNVLGLTVGLACCALVAVFLQYELTWDAHHEHADRTYRILDVTKEASGNSTFSTLIFKGNGGAGRANQRLLSIRLRAQIPEIEQAAIFEIFSGDPTFVETPNGTRYESDRQLLTNTGPAFADLFTFERIAGAPLEDALSRPYSAVLPRSMAEKYFGDQNPIGKTLILDSLEATVRAVIEDPPANSRIRFDFAMQVEQIPNWGAYHYVRLVEGADPKAVAPKIHDVYDEIRPRRVEDNDEEVTRLQALTNIHFADRALYDDDPHRNPAYLWVFGAIGLLILVITTINYANLGLALYADRNEEIGVRKAMGGYQRQIAGQFLAEAGLLALACVPLALGLCAAVLPEFNALMDTEIGAGRLLRPAVLGGTVGLALLTGLVAGGYPALVLARKDTVDLFGRGLSTGGGGDRGWSLRHGLIGLQFVVLIGLGSLSCIAYDQLQFMQSSDLGYDTDAVVRTNFAGDSTDYHQFRRRLLESSAIQAVGSAGSQGVPRTPANQAPYSLVGSEGRYKGTSRAVDMHWFEVMGIEHPVVDSMLAAGASAPTRHLLNRAAAEALQAEDPVGETLQNNPPDGDNFRVIDGVVDNLRLNSARRAVIPAVYDVYSKAPYGYNVLVRLAPGRTPAGLERIREVWADMKPDTPLQTSFLSAEVAELYQQERRFTALAGVLAALAILMAAIGLAALVAYLTRLRTKEIGVRKALGGSTRSIVALLNKEYVQIVGAAFVVGAPLAWLAADWWLGRFAYQIDLSVWPFLAAGVGALVVAVAAVSGQALRAAQVDPARVLRSE
jgi:putative ABC transport system permease protein